MSHDSLFRHIDPKRDNRGCNSTHVLASYGGPVYSAACSPVSSCCSPPSMHAFPVIFQHCEAYISLHCLPTLSACTIAWSALCTCGVPQDPPRCAILWIRRRAVYPCCHLSLQCMSNSIIVSIGFLSLMLLIARVRCECRSL